MEIDPQLTGETQSSASRAAASRSQPPSPDGQSSGADPDKRRAPPAGNSNGQVRTGAAAFAAAALTSTPDRLGSASVLSPSTPASRSAANAAAAHYHDDGSGGEDGDSPTPNDAHDPDNPAAGAGGTDPKKPRACEACRGLKVRCEPDPANPEGACRRCAKAGRSCVVTQPTRKRQKKTDSRVAELEKKIDALTASLQATRGGAGTPGGGSGPSGSAGGAPVAGSASTPSSSVGGVAPAAASDRNGGGGGGVPGAAAGGASIGLLGALLRPQPDPTSSSGYNVPAFGHRGSAAREWATGGSSSRDAAPHAQRVQQSFAMDVDKPGYPPPMVMAGQKRKHTETRESAEEDTRDGPRDRRPLPPIQATVASEHSDAIDRGIMTMERATELFARYTDQMMQHLPAVVFPDGTTAAEVRKSKPILFLAVMSASSSEDPNLQRILVRELMQIFAEKVIITGEKSLELVQALHIAVIWYWPPEHFEELKFYQLVHIGAVMAIDIGLGRKKQSGRMRRHIPYTWRDHPFKKNPPPDPMSIESRRAWLVCYFLSSNTSMALHRPVLLRWTPFMSECVDILESSPDAAPTDKYLCHLVWTHRLAEEIGISFSMDDPSADINIADARTQYALRGFERDLEKYRSTIPREQIQSTLDLSFHVLSLYMHEIALHTEKVESSFADNVREAAQQVVSDAVLTPAHINALSACLTAIDGIFDAFLAMDVGNIRCLPVFNFVRVAYAVVVLIKMYFAASSPTSELGKVINKDNMKVDQYLESLLEKFRATAADDRSRPAAKFLVILVMLRSWFHRQSRPGSKRAGDGAVPACDGARGEQQSTPLGFQDAGAQRAQGHEQQAERSGFSPQVQGQKQAGPLKDYPTTANTPLQLLSEVATNDPSANGSPSRAAGASQAGSNILQWASSQQQQPGGQQQFLYDGGSGTPASGDGPQMSSWPNNSAALPGGGADFDYSSMLGADGFQDALDLTLGGFTGSMGIGMNLDPAMGNSSDGTGSTDGSGGAVPGMRYMMQEPWFGEMMSSNHNLFNF